MVAATFEKGYTSMEKRRKAVFWAVLLSETSHLFCCVLPSVFSVLSLLVGVGMISNMVVITETMAMAGHIIYP